ncbi:MAG: mono/diheme cytochrome c family protein [Pseudohongiellaceae bacterium]
MSISIRKLAIMVLVLLLFLTAAIFLLNDKPADSGPILASSASNPELVARGEYLAKAGNCASCHTAEGGEFMAGGLAFDTPFGTLFSTNISPDTETGIGDWSERDFLNSMRHGLRPNGEHLYPAFPYTAFTKIENEDVFALYNYFQSIPAVPQTPFENSLTFPFNIRSLMAVWKTLFFDVGEFEPNESQTDEWNRGAYLVDALAHCSACHSPRNLLGAEKTHLAMSGGEYIDRVNNEAKRPWSAPNITATQRGLDLWSHQNLKDYLKTARNDILESFGPMNEVIINSTSYLSEDDVGAMATYLKDLNPIAVALGSAPDPQLMGRGRTIYNLHCGTCHLPTGEGDPKMAPKLHAGSLVVQSENPASMINAILYSPKTPGPPLLPKWRHPMEEFQYLLDDNEVAAVASFIRNSWSNSAGIVTAEQIARQR